MRRKFLLATLTTIVLGATAMPAAALETNVTSSDSDTGIVHVEPAQDDLGAAVVDVDVDSEDGSGSLTAGGYVAPADEGGSLTVGGSSAGPEVTQDDYAGPTSDDDPIVIGQEGVGEVSVDPDTLTVGVKVDPLGVDESVSLAPADEEPEPEPEPAPATPTTQASNPEPVVLSESSEAPEPTTTTTQSSGPREVFSTPREVFPNAKPEPAEFEFSTDDQEPVVADGVQAAGPIDDATGSGTSDALLKLFALLMFGTTGYAWWFAKENGLV